MNKRIREIAERADENYTGIHDDCLALVGNEAIQKFAELIIKECLTIADRKGAYQVMDDIIERFGVEL